MNFNEYQEWTRTTVQYPEGSSEREMAYLTLGVAGEAGEVAEKVKKFLRGDIKDNYEAKADLLIGLVFELGDLLWYLTRLADVLNMPLDVIVNTNMTKLQARMDNGTIKGDGDER